MHDPFVEGTPRDDKYEKWRAKSQKEIIEKLARKSNAYVASNIRFHDISPVVKKTNEELIELIQEILDII